MSGRVAGKVALITGAGRGQGRNHAVRLAREGADVIAVDVPGAYAEIDYPMATVEDLAETARLVEAEDRRVLPVTADIRNADALRAAVDEAVGQFGRLDVVVANAAVCKLHAWHEVTPQVWSEVVDTTLTGTWNTIAATAPHLIAVGGGSIVAVGSTSALKGTPFFAPYTAAKHGVVGLAKAMANELARHSIRVNTVHPAGVRTALTGGLKRLDELIGTDPSLGPVFMNALPTQWVEPDDVSSAVVYLASDESRYVTGTELKVDAGNTNR
ncbi:mycofactocin-coupled SDR family oxidoreductase [Geodermatophilus sp. CPCC 205761]|uniref:mycofactocin-coupled SDR family oxidoreductase n=1 Tax=Geodermatophilus sp. CPCC 205761 TaxID=2936597 RepID=UPI003EEBA2A3